MEEKTKSRKEVAYDKMYDHLQTIYEEHHYKIKDENFLNFIDKIFNKIDSFRQSYPKNVAAERLIGGTDLEDNPGIEYPFVIVDETCFDDNLVPTINIQWILIKEHGYYIEKRIFNIKYIDSNDKYFTVVIKQQTFSNRNGIKNCVAVDRRDLNNGGYIYRNFDKFDVDGLLSMLVGLSFGYEFSTNEDDYERWV